MFRHINSREQLIQNLRKNEQLENQQSNIDLVTSITFVTLAEKGDIDEVTAIEHTDLFTPWGSGINYTIGALRKYNDELYRCVQTHTSQDDWTPDVAVALWVKTGSPLEEYLPWSAPVGAHDAYALGAKVTHNNQKWISIIDANIWEPGVHGWEVINE